MQKKNYRVGQCVLCSIVNGERKKYISRDSDMKYTQDIATRTTKKLQNETIRKATKTIETNTQLMGKNVHSQK